MVLHPSAGRLLVLHNADRLCLPCLRKLSRITRPSTRKLSSTAKPSSIAFSFTRNGPDLFGKNYFSANGSLLQKTWARDGSAANPAKEVSSATSVAGQGNEIPPPAQTFISSRERPRRRRRKVQDATESSVEEQLPPDAPSRLSEISSSLPQNSWRKRFFTYLALSKPRLTFLIVLTTTASYSLFPVPVDPFSASMNLSALTLLNLTTGTALASASANTLNMLLEPAYDAKMSRTRTRPLVRGLVTPRAALAFAVLTGGAGVSLLHFGVNPTVAFLGALNIALYAGAYTPLKRLSVANTWVGALVGGVPPLMGWAAAAGQASPLAHPGWRELLFDPATAAGGWLLAALLFAWQFPHFNALSFPIRHEYAAAGYRMLASVDPRRNARVALRYALALVPICAGLSVVGVTSWAFVAGSGLVNAWVVREAWRFWRHEGGRGTARGLFWASVWHLPLVLVLAMVCKTGLWERFMLGGFSQEELRDYVDEREERVEREAVVARSSTSVSETAH